MGRSQVKCCFVVAVAESRVGPIAQQQRAYLSPGHVTTTVELEDKGDMS